MIPSTLIRWSGLAAVVGGILQVSADVLLMLTVGEGNTYTVTVPGQIASVLFLAGKLLLIVALIGLYLYQAEAAGKFGLVAFLSALVGTTLMGASDWVEVFFSPAIAEIAPSFFNEPPTLLIVGFIMNYGLETLGWLLFGIATFRARVFPRPAAVMLTAAILVPFGLPWIYVVSNSAMVWLGLIVLSDKQDLASVEQVEMKVLPL